MAQERACVQSFSWDLYLESHTCQIGPFAHSLFTCLRHCPGEIHRSLPQVSGEEAEPSPGTQEKQPWEQRLEHLQQAVAQLEVDRSRLQHHNSQLRATLEQVASILSSVIRAQWTCSLLLALLSEQGWCTLAQGPGSACCLFLKIKFYGDTAKPLHSCIVYSFLQATVMELNSYNRDQMAHKPQIPQKMFVNLCSKSLRGLPTFPAQQHFLALRADLACVPLSKQFSSP